MRCGNPVLLTLALAAAAALGLAGFVSLAPNRLVTGAPLALWAAADAAHAAAIAALVAMLLAAAFAAPTKAVAASVLAAAALLLLLLLDGAGEAARARMAEAPAAARVSLGAGFWIACLAAALVMLDAVQRCAVGPAMRLAAVVVVAGAAAVLLASGRLDALSLSREYASHRVVFRGELVRHCALVLGALAPALAIGVPLGIAATRRARLRTPLLAVLNLVQTVPSIALFGLLLAPLTALAAAVPALAAAGVHGIGAAPALIALVLYALLPIVRSTLAGLRGVDAAVIESASGMGMTARQVFWRVELPLSLPVLLAGLRVVVVQAIGLAAVAALIGAGGLGTFVFQGIGQYAIDLVLLGAVPTILLALAADLALALLVERFGGSAR